MMTLVLPCGGSGSRLALPYPKELMAVAPGRLLIDSALKVASRAGVAHAVIVTTDEKLRQLSSALGPARHGVTFTYLVREQEVVKSDAGSILRGCKRAQLAEKSERYLVAYPDVQYEDELAAVNLLKAGQPAYATMGTGRVQLAAFDKTAAARLRRYLMSSPLEEARGDAAFNRLVSMDKANWHLADVGKAVDVNDWEGAKEALKKGFRL